MIKKNYRPYEDYIGKEIKIIHLAGEDPKYDGKVGKVVDVGIDCKGQPYLAGTWSSLVIYPLIDQFEILESEGE